MFLIFIESYGAIAYERQDMAPPLASARADLAAAIHGTGRDVVSAFVESPTFGGSSWLAHLSLMSGIEVRDPETNATADDREARNDRDQLQARGAPHDRLMPGLRQVWPEGAFYNFDEIYGASRIAYHGPEFGWFAVPDQFTLAKFDALEKKAGGASAAVRVLSNDQHPFSVHPDAALSAGLDADVPRAPDDGPSIVRAYAQQPDWTLSARATSTRSATTTPRSPAICVCTRTKTS